MKSKLNKSENFSYLVVALLISLILWIAILGTKETTAVKDVEVDYILPEKAMATNSMPDKVRFRLAGPQLKLKKFLNTSKEPLTIDLTSRSEGRSTVTLHSDSISLLPGIRVLSVSPSLISVNLERFISKIVPIEIVTSGQLTAGKRLVRMKVEPDKISVEGARSAVSELSSIQTEPINLAEISNSVTLDVNTNLKDPLISKKSHTTVKVHLVVE